jgi:hypothetical protein
MDKFVYKIESEKLETLNDLVIRESFPIEDNRGNKLVVNKLTLCGTKVFFETVYLKVLKVSHNKLYLELPDSHIKLFNWLDDKSTELLEKLLDNSDNKDISDISDIFECFVEIPDIEYKSLLDDGSNIIKINVFSDTTIKLFGKTVELDEIKPNDYVGLVLGLDYISLLVGTDLKSLLARTKLYCYYVEIHKQHTYNPEPREKINQWEFSSKLKSENIFVKTQTTENDNFDVKTEIQEHVDEQMNNLVLSNNMKLDTIDENVNSSLSETKQTVNHNLDPVNEQDIINNGGTNHIDDDDETSSEICFVSDIDNDKIVNINFEPDTKSKQEPDYELKENIKLLSSVLDDCEDNAKIVSEVMDENINVVKKNTRTKQQKQTVIKEKIDKKKSTVTKKSTDKKILNGTKKSTGSKNKIETIITENDSNNDNMPKNINQSIELMTENENKQEPKTKSKRGRKT